MKSSTYSKSCKSIGDLEVPALEGHSVLGGGTAKKRPPSGSTIRKTRPAIARRLRRNSAVVYIQFHADCRSYGLEVSKAIPLLAVLQDTHENADVRINAGLLIDEIQLGKEILGSAPLIASVGYRVVKMCKDVLQEIEKRIRADRLDLEREGVPTSKDSFTPPRRTGTRSRNAFRRIKNDPARHYFRMWPWHIRSLKHS